MTVVAKNEKIEETYSKTLLLGEGHSTFFYFKYSSTMDSECIKAGRCSDSHQKPISIKTKKLSFLGGMKTRTKVCGGFLPTAH